VAAFAGPAQQRPPSQVMSSVPARLRRRIFRRAGGRCEYCGLSQVGQEATFHVDHVIPRAKGGATEPANLALACVSCSLMKEARTSALEPETRRVVRFFHPRRQKWHKHFRWDGVVIVGLSAVGRATVDALQMNRPRILAIREEESMRGRHLPP
jgi:hypothetical protein